MRRALCLCPRRSGAPLSRDPFEERPGLPRRDRDRRGAVFEAGADRLHGRGSRADPACRARRGGRRFPPLAVGRHAPGRRALRGADQRLLEHRGGRSGAAGARDPRPEHVAAAVRAQADAADGTHRAGLPGPRAGRRAPPLRPAAVRLLPSWLDLRRPRRLLRLAVAGAARGAAGRARLSRPGELVARRRPARLVEARSTRAGRWSTSRSVPRATWA